MRQKRTCSSSASINCLVAEIRVNEKVVKKTTRLFSEPLQERHEFEVGQNERHTVFIEKQRKLLFGQKYVVYVNQRIVKLLHGF